MLAASTANDGSHAITVPVATTTTARVKVAAVGNVFFDISDQDFSIQPLPAALAEPISIIVDAAGNQVMDHCETASLAPTWRNVGAAAMTGVTGALSISAPHTTIQDGAAAYGTLAVGAIASCTATGDCYAMSGCTAGRPVHYDVSVRETVAPSGNIKNWILHVGTSFTDVAPASPFYRFVETMLHKGITGGCTSTTFCPAGSTTREQMAVFVLVAKEPPGYIPAACSTPIFADVPASSPFCRWIEELARRGVVSGCGNGHYCPSAPASREAMAVFVLRTLDPALNPPACAPPNLFLDVPETSGFCRWIEELAHRGIVTGCGGGSYCPSAAVTREQMSVFLGVTFGLALYGL